MKIDPNYADARNNKTIALKIARAFKIANEFYSSGKLNEALEIYDKITEIHPDFPHAWINKGLTLWYIMLGTSGNVDMSKKALQCFDKALELRPNFPKALFNKGQFLKYLGNNIEGKKYVNMAYELGDPFAD